MIERSGGRWIQIWAGIGVVAAIGLTAAAILLDAPWWVMILAGGNLLVQTMLSAIAWQVVEMDHHDVNGY